jgi:hypothetical protein
MLLPSFRAKLRQGDMGNHLLHLDAVFCAIPDQVPRWGSSTRYMRCLSPRHAWTFTRHPCQVRVGASDWSSGPVCSVGADASSRHSVPEAQPTSRNAKALAARVSSAGTTVAREGVKRDERGLADYPSGSSTETSLYLRPVSSLLHNRSSDGPRRYGVTS